MTQKHNPLEVQMAETVAAGLRYKVVASCEIEIPPPCGLTIFGASGDLTKRKLMPALYRLHQNGLLPEHFFVLGTGRTAMDDNRFRAEMNGAVKDAVAIFDEDRWATFSEMLYYSSFQFDDAQAYVTKLRDRLPTLEKRHQTRGNRIFYLAVPPSIFSKVIENLGAAGLSSEEAGCSHVVIEKPFGRDLASARDLNRAVHEFFEERQVYRIDHYLAKETVQSILMFRFANLLFEPLWNCMYIDHVQITAAETVGIERRAGYYEEAGVIRDMFQNHVFQLLSLTAMEPPAFFIADRVQDEKAKVLRSVKRYRPEEIEESVVIGQYTAGRYGGTEVPGYRDEEGVDARSSTPTYAAIRLCVDNWRWHGVPFYLRSGKRLASRKTEISVHFKYVPHSMFPDTVSGPVEPNTLVLRIQPNEGMSLLFQTKMPGSKVCLSPVEMQYSYPRGVLLDAYEWVLLDCMLGDHMLFMREDSVELAWSILTPILARVEGGGLPLHLYRAGSEGAEAATRLLERDGRAWRPL